jgi:hypothetical protein
MSKFKSNQTQNKIERLYELTDRIDESSVRLMKAILDYYNLKTNAIYAINPDIEKTIVLKNDVIDYEDIDIEDVLKDCDVIVELFDGYETAFACIY